jgi:23S rRNA pseudouridine2605 synthase
MRVRFGPINLPPRIKRGQWLELNEKEIRRLLALLARRQPGNSDRSEDEAG